MVHYQQTGHSLWDVARFQDDTRHMIEFEVLTDGTRFARQGQRARLFLSEPDYQKALEQERRGKIRIAFHANIIEGHILPAPLHKHRKRRR